MDQIKESGDSCVQGGRGKFSFVIGVICGFIGAAVLAALLSWYTFQGRVVAKVDGKPIRYTELNETLGKTHGREVLGFLVEKKLIEEEAKRRGLKVDEREIAAKLKELKATCRSEEEFTDFLKERHLTVKDIEEQIHLQLLAEKLTGEVEAGEEELREFYEQFKARYDGQPYDEVKAEVTEDYKAFMRARMVPQAVQELKEKAKVVYYW